MWSVYVATVVNSIERQRARRRLHQCNEQEDSSTNEEGPVTGCEISTVVGASFTIEGNPASNVESLGGMQGLAEV